MFKIGLQFFLAQQIVNQVEASCFVQSQEALGPAQGDYLNDLSIISDSQVDKVTAQHRINGIQICEDANGHLTGLETQTKASYQNQWQEDTLVSMHKFGTTDKMNCKLLDVYPDQGILALEIGYNADGVTRLAFTRSDGAVILGGIQNPKYTRKFTFTPKNQLMGFWGRSRNDIAKLGVIQRQPCSELPNFTPVTVEPDDDRTTNDSFNWNIFQGKPMNFVLSFSVCVIVIGTFLLTIFHTRKILLKNSKAKVLPEIQIMEQTNAPKLSIFKPKKQRKVLVGSHNDYIDVECQNQVLNQNSEHSLRSQPQQDYVNDLMDSDRLAIVSDAPFSTIGNKNQALTLEDPAELESLQEQLRYEEIKSLDNFNLDSECIEDDQRAQNQSVVPTVNEVLMMAQPRFSSANNLYSEVVTANHSCKTLQQLVGSGLEQEIKSSQTENEISVTHDLAQSIEHEVDRSGSKFSLCRQHTRQTMKTIQPVVATPAFGVSSLPDRKYTAEESQTVESQANLSSKILECDSPVPTHPFDQEPITKLTEYENEIGALSIRELFPKAEVSDFQLSEPEDVGENSEQKRRNLDRHLSLSVDQELQKKDDPQQTEKYEPQPIQSDVLQERSIQGSLSAITCPDLSLTDEQFPQHMQVYSGDRNSAMMTTVSAIENAPIGCPKYQGSQCSFENQLDASQTHKVNQRYLSLQPEETLQPVMIIRSVTEISACASETSTPSKTSDLVQVADSCNHQNQSYCAQIINQTDTGKLRPCSLFQPQHGVGTLPKEPQPGSNSKSVTNSSGEENMIREILNSGKISANEIQGLGKAILVEKTSIYCTKSFDRPASQQIQFKLQESKPENLRLHSCDAPIRANLVSFKDEDNPNKPLPKSKKQRTSSKSPEKARLPVKKRYRSLKRRQIYYNSLEDEIAEITRVLKNLLKRKKAKELTDLDMELLNGIRKLVNSNPQGYSQLQGYLRLLYQN